MTALVFDPSDPRRPPDWRHRRARQLLVEHRPASRVSDDLVTRWLFEFLRAAARGARQQNRADLQRGDRALAAAVALHAGGIEIRQSVEAYLLAGAASSEVAERFGAATEAIDLYHDCFFDVRDRLARRALVVEGLILAAPQREAGASEIGIALRLLGYLHGVATLDALSGGGGDKSHRFAVASDALVEVLGYVMIRRRPVTAEAIAAKRLVQAAREPASAKTSMAQHDYEHLMSEFLSTLSFRKLERNSPHIPPQLKPYLDSQIELRAAEESFICRGNTLPYAEDLLAGNPPPFDPQALTAAEGGGHA